MLSITDSYEPVKRFSCPSEYLVTHVHETTASNHYHKLTCNPVMEPYLLQTNLTLLIVAAWPPLSLVRASPGGDGRGPGETNSTWMGVTKISEIT